MKRQPTDEFDANITHAGQGLADISGINATLDWIDVLLAEVAEWEKQKKQPAKSTVRPDPKIRRLTIGQRIVAEHMRKKSLQWG